MSEVTKPAVKPEAKSVAKKAVKKPAGKPKALPAGISETFKKRPDLKEVFISRDSGEWFFNEKRAIKHFRGNYDIIQNPTIK